MLLQNQEKDGKKLIWVLVSGWWKTRRYEIKRETLDEEAISRTFWRKPKRSTNGANGHIKSIWRINGQNRSLTKRALKTWKNELNKI